MKGLSRRCFLKPMLVGIVTIAAGIRGQFDRDRQADAGTDIRKAPTATALNDPQRRMLGRTRERRLHRRLRNAADTAWQVE